MIPQLPIQAAATVYGVIMNDAVSVTRLGDAASKAPYQGLPKSVVLYIKPKNTWASPGACIPLPHGEEHLEVGATIGLRMATDAARVPVGQALQHIDACLLMADLSVPHREYFRPAIRQKCFDGALPMIELPALAASDVGDVVLRTHVDGLAIDERHLSRLLRPVPRLIADVSEFMTLRCGDVLMVGVVYRAPTVAAGAQACIEAAGFGSLEFSIGAAP